MDVHNCYCHLTLHINYTDSCRLINDVKQSVLIIMRCR